MKHTLQPLPALMVLAAFTIAPVQADSSSDDPLHVLSHLFQKEAIVGEPKIVDCKLSGGEMSKCFAITVTGQPVDHATGPWCPPTITAGKEEGGIWLEKDKVNDVDGAFIKNLHTFYDDKEWKLYDEATGKVRITDTKESCQAAARPNVDPAYQNYCVECELEYMETSTQRTYVLPIKPVAAKQSERVTDDIGVGVALNGVRIDGPAPKDAILVAHTLAPFDNCGGHINLHVGYHYHALTGCSKKVASTEKHAPVIGLAMDGYPLHAQLNPDGKEPADLDECRGHDVAGIGYHYHANNPAGNAILSCFTAQTGCSNEGTDTSCDASNRPVRRPPPGGGQGRGQRGTPPGFAEAAKTLGFTETEFMKIIEDAGGRQLDFAKAAEALGVSEEKLRGVLPPPPVR